MMTTTRRHFLKVAGLGVATLAAPMHALAAARKGRPNIIVIMADDMGFSDPGCFGGEIDTPNLNALAKGGLRFTQFYNCARCCPTRASLMTGQYPHQVGLRSNGRSLRRTGLTIAEALRPAGYRTAMAGKWHLSLTPNYAPAHQKWVDHQVDPDIPFGPIDTYPVNRGFEKHYGIIWGVIDYFDPFSLVDGTKAVKEVPDDYYITNAITDKSVEYIKEFSKGDDPFFLYIAHCAPHWPLHALPEDIKKYKGKYDGGWQKLRDDRYRRIIDMGLFDKANTPLPPLTRGAEWKTLSPADRKLQSSKMAVHAAMVDRVDQGIGRVTKALKDAGQFDNTLILFLADNGASPEIMTGPGYDRTAQTREGKKVQYRNFTDLGAETSYACIGAAWASAANTPFRYWKKESYEGGCHTPLIAHWPDGLKTKPGSITTQIGHVMDIMPTCLELAGATYPKTYKGGVLSPIQGKTLTPILKGKQRDGHEHIFFEHTGGRAVRSGNWKLTALPGKPWDLYDLSTDRTETKNLAAQHPEKVQALSKLWTQWAIQMGLSPTKKRPKR